MNQKHTIIILAYNEEKHIGQLLDALVDYNVIAVIDGNDSSQRIAREYSNVCVLSSNAKRGYGKALCDGISLAHSQGYEYATVMDVGTCDPDNLCVVLHNQPDVFIRRRIAQGITSPRVILSLLAAIALSIVTRRHVPDATFGYRTYKLDTVYPLTLALRTNGHATNLELLGLVLKNGLTVRHMCVPYVKGTNTQLKARDIVDAIRIIVKLLFSW